MRALAFIIILVVPLLSTWSHPAGAAESVDAVVFVDRGVLAYERKDYEQALKEFDEALRADPGSVNALYYRGLVLIALKRTDEGLGSLEQARARARDDLEIAFQIALQYFGQGEYAKAEPLLRQVYEKEPNRPNLGFYLGVIEYRKRNYRTALKFLDAAMPSDESFVQLVSFYQGLAKSALGHPRQAAADIEKALTVRPGSPLGDPARRFAELLNEKASEERRFHGKIRFGIFYDTNPAVIPDDSGDIVVQSILAGQDRQKSAGQVFASELAYTFLKNVDWEASISHRFYQTLNNHIPDLNLQSNAPTLNIVKRGGIESSFGEMSYSAGLQTFYEYLSLGNSPFLHSGFVNPYFTLAETPSNLTYLQYRFRYRDFANEGDVSGAERRSGPNYMVGGLHYVTFSNNRHFVNMGYQFDFDDTQGSNWRYYGNRLLAGFQYSLPWGALKFRYNMDLQWRNYTNKNTLLDLQPGTGAPTTKRSDFEMIFFSSLFRDFTVLSQKFTVAFDYLYDQNFSNLDPYTYKRHVVTTSVTWHF